MPGVLPADNSLCCLSRRRSCPSGPERRFSFPPCRELALTPTIPCTEPLQLAANASATWSRQAGDYPASTYTLVYYFAGPETFQVAADADGENFLVTIAPANTADLPAGVYRWSSFFELGAPVTERWPDRTGVLELLADLTHAPPNSQLFEEQMIEAIEARLTGRLEADLESYGIAGRTAMKIEFRNLSIALGVWKAKLWRVMHRGQPYLTHRATFRAPR